MIRLSLRARVLAGMALVVVALVVVAVIVTATTRSHLVDQVDDRLAAAGDHDRGGDERAAARRRRASTATACRTSTRACSRPTASWTRSSRRTSATTTTSRRRTSTPSRRPPRAAAGEPFTIGAVGDDGLRYRVRRARRSGRQAAGSPASRSTDVDDTIGRLVIVEVVATAVILALLAAVAWWVVRLGIRPIKQMTRTAEQIAGGDLSQRVPEAPPSTEAGQLGAALNHMLERLDAAFTEQAASEERLRRFVADASHELRTPVTTIRGYAELYRVGGLADRERARRGDAAHRAGGRAHGPPRRRPAQPGQARRGPAARAAAGRPRPARRRRRPRRRRRRPATADHDRARRTGRRVAATRTGCARSSPTSSATRSCTRRRRRRSSCASRGDGTSARIAVVDHGPGMTAGGRRPGHAALLPRRPGAGPRPRRQRARDVDRRRRRQRPRRRDRRRQRRRPGTTVTVTLPLPVVGLTLANSEVDLRRTLRWVSLDGLDRPNDPKEGHPMKTRYVLAVAAGLATPDRRRRHRRRPVRRRRHADDDRRRRPRVDDRPDAPTRRPNRRPTRPTTAPVSRTPSSPRPASDRPAARAAVTTRQATPRPSPTRTPATAPADPPPAERLTRWARIVRAHRRVCAEARPAGGDNGAMHDDRELVEERITRELPERVLPLVHPQRRPLTVEAGPSLDELAPFDVGRPVGPAVGHDVVPLHRRGPGGVDRPAGRGAARPRVPRRRARVPVRGPRPRRARAGRCRASTRAARPCPLASDAGPVELVVEAASNPTFPQFRPSPLGSPETAGERLLYRLDRAELVLVDADAEALRARPRRARRRDADAAARRPAAGPPAACVGRGPSTWSPVRPAAATTPSRRPAPCWRRRSPRPQARAPTASSPPGTPTSTRRGCGRWPRPCASARGRSPRRWP